MMMTHNLNNQNITHPHQLHYNHEFEKRSAESRRILSKYPDRIPVICDRNPRSADLLPEIEKKKFLVPDTMLCGQFKYIIHKHINQAAASLSNNSNSKIGNLAADQTIYLFVGSTGTSPKTGALLSEVYDAYKSVDGFLYITYSAENTLGSNDIRYSAENTLGSSAENSTLGNSNCSESGNSNYTALQADVNDSDMKFNTNSLTRLSLLPSKTDSVALEVVDDISSNCGAIRMEQSQINHEQTENQNDSQIKNQNEVNDTSKTALI